MVAIHPMTLPEVRAEWGYIRNGLLEVIGRCHERYAPEDVWTEVMAGHAYAWRIERAGDDLGFLILKRLNDPDGPVLFIWCVYAEPGTLIRSGRDLLERLKELGHRMGAKRVRFESPRKGWAFVNAFDERSVIYEHEL